MFYGFIAAHMQISPSKEAEKLEATNNADASANLHNNNKSEMLLLLIIMQSSQLNSNEYESKVKMLAIVFEWNRNLKQFPSIHAGFKL